MGVFYKVSPKELLEIRNNIFLSKGLPTLVKNGFEKSPFSSSWFGRNNLRDFSYEFCRINEQSHLEIIEIYIDRGDSWINGFLIKKYYAPLGLQKMD
jgi:hypothetical protein